MGCIFNYLHDPIRRGIILANNKLRNPLCSFKNQPKRVLTTQGVSSSSLSSPLSSKYEVFFPSFYRQYEIDIINSNIAVDKHAESGTAREVPNIYPMACPDFEDNPHYTHDDDLHDNKPIIVKQGQHLDVISLLSTHGDDLVRIGSNKLIKADDLRGKYVLLCCGLVPSLWVVSYDWWDVSLLSSELSQPHTSIKHYFEIVIVPKMRQKWDNDEDAYHHFLSAFPGCLAVPFGDKYRCDYICKSLNLGFHPLCILVDPSQTVLQVGFENTVVYGARGFPFTDEHFSFLRNEVEWSEPCSPSIKSLAGLLDCESNPSSLLLRKFDSDEIIPAEQLSKHHVGLYLFKDGYLLREVQDFHQRCRDQGLDLEIVLVSIPEYSAPRVYQDAVECVLREHRVSDWWVFPYNNSAWRRLRELCRSSKDSLFIVGPNNKFVEREAGEVILYFGHHLGLEAYPFTMEALFRAFLHRLETVTLESFLTYGYLYRDYECDDTKIIPVSELKGKNVLVYADYSFCSWSDVIDWYSVIKEKDPDFELVYVPMMVPKPDTEYSKLASEVRELVFESKTKWLICPFEDPQQSQYLKNHNAFLFKKGLYMAKKGLPISSVLAFGKDGRLYSLDALRLLDDNGLDVYPFIPESRIQNLCDEIGDALVYEFDLCDIYRRDLMNTFDFLPKYKTQD